MRKIRFFGFSVKSEYILLTLIVIGGIILRLEASNHLRVIGPDGVAYVSSSSNFLRGVGEFERRGPLYQGLLSLSYFVFGVSYESSVLISQLFGTIAVILIFFLGKSLFNSETGLVAALIITINPIFTNFSAWVLRETLGITLVIALILIVHYSVKINHTKKRIFLTFMSGVVAGLGVLTREEMSLVIPIACIAYFFFIKKQKRVFLLDSAVFLIGLLLVMSPWLLYSANSFGDGLYSYRFYIEGVTYDTVEGDLTGTSGEPLYIGIPKAFLLGSWRFIIEWPALFSILPLFFIPIGIIHTLKRRDLWIIYFLLIIDVVFVSYLASDPEYFDRLITGYNWSDPLRFFSSIGMPFNVIIAAGIVKTIPFITDLLTYKSHESKNHIKIKVSRNIKIWQRRFSRLFSIKTFSILGIILIILVSYVPPFIFTFDYLDQRTEQPFVQAGNYLNSIGSNEGVFTTNSQLLSKYYKGPIYDLPPDCTFQIILENAQQYGIKYILVDSTSITSQDLINLYYLSVYPESYYSNLVPSDFILLNSVRWQFGIYVIQPEIWFDAAILGNVDPWNNFLEVAGGTVEAFNENTSLYDLDLSQFDLIVFNDFRRPINDTERQYLENAIDKGLIVVNSGLSPYFLAGGTNNLTEIETWFGATSFSEAPKLEKWTVKFTQNAISVFSGLDIEREYIFYTDSNWSTPIGVSANLESILYAYRPEDNLATIIAHNFGSGKSIFVGPRYGFFSSDSTTFWSFMQSLIYKYLKGY